MAIALQETKVDGVAELQHDDGVAYQRRTHECFSCDCELDMVRVQAKRRAFH
jgi:hypothetical protein